MEQKKLWRNTACEAQQQWLEVFLIWEQWWKGTNGEGSGGWWNGIVF